DGWGLFTALTKAGIKLGAMKWGDAATEVLKGVECVKFKDDRGGLAWSLVYRAMTKAILGLLDESRTVLTPAQVQQMEVQAKADDQELLAEGVAIDKQFFDHPGWSEYCREAGKRFRGWLTRAGMDEGSAHDLAWSLPRHFTTALSREWLENKKHLDELKL